MGEKTILSTKRLSQSQKGLLLNAGFRLVEYDAIAIEYVDFEAPNEIENAIFTSQNAVRSYVRNGLPSEAIANCFCVGEKTASLLVENGQKVTKIAQNSSKLADFIKKQRKNDTFYYFCGSRRRDEIPIVLKSAKIELFEIKTYRTVLKTKYFDQKWNGILFFSPSGVECYVEGQKSVNHSSNEIPVFPESTAAFCIGETTAAEVIKYTDNVIVSNSTTVESVIAKAVKTLNKN